MENSKGSARNNELLKARDSLCLIHQTVKMQLHSQGTHFFWKGSTDNQRKDWSPVWPQTFGERARAALRTGNHRGGVYLNPSQITALGVPVLLVTGIFCPSVPLWILISISKLN